MGRADCATEEREQLDSIATPVLRPGRKMRTRVARYSAPIARITFIFDLYVTGTGSKHHNARTRLPLQSCLARNHESGQAGAPLFHFGRSDSSTRQFSWGIIGMDSCHLVVIFSSKLTRNSKSATPEKFSQSPKQLRKSIRTKVLRGVNVRAVSLLRAGLHVGAPLSERKMSSDTGRGHRNHNGV